ncbi:hypothetical protein WJX81_008255 [Elliptochloris bilobata]|uniref:Uncharacterized protein n=1 Tax=Elliptochloris bilobata TaxID=381761 RepID=A0AAW1RCF2_9CHLO
MPGRREAQAAVARRRAQHFALYRNEDEPDQQDELHVGGSEARTLGPWSSARQLAEGRGAAAAAREAKILESARAAKAAAADAAALEWQPRRDPTLGPRPGARVASLVAICVDLVVAHLVDVDTLWGMPDVIKARLSAAAAGARKLTPAALALFTDGEPSELVLSECSQLEPAVLAPALANASGEQLERLELGMCGRGFGDDTAATLAGVGPLPVLRSLRLGGAYRLTDAGLAPLLRRAPMLEALALPQCSRLDGAFLVALPGSLRALDLAECRGVGKDALLAALAQAPNVAELALDGNPEVDDAALAAIAQACPHLRRLSVANCAGVGEAGLAAAARALPSLTALVADDCGRAGDAALLALAEACPRLEEVSLRRCARVGDAGMAALAAGCALRRLRLPGCHMLGAAAVLPLAGPRGVHLEELDVSWCRGIPEEALGRLVDACPALTCLTLFGCSQVTGRFLHGHASEHLRVIGAQAQKAPALSAARAVLAA